MSDPIIFAIDGAITLKAFEDGGEMDGRYHYGALYGDMLLVSEDGLDFVIGMKVSYQGNTATRKDLVEALRRPRWN